jgi:hypothetical protein
LNSQSHDALDGLPDFDDFTTATTALEIEGTGPR